MPSNLTPIAIAYVPDSKLPEGRAVIPLSLVFNGTNKIVDLSAILGVRPFSGVKGIYIDYENNTFGGQLILTVESTGQVFNLSSSTAHSCT